MGSIIDCLHKVVGESVEVFSLSIFLATYSPLCRVSTGFYSVDCLWQLSHVVSAAI